MNFQCMNRCWIFSRCEPTRLCVKTMCSVLRRTTFLPGEVIVKEGDLVREMFFLDKGFVVQEAPKKDGVSHTGSKNNSRNASYLRLPITRTKASPRTGSGSNSKDGSRRPSFNKGSRSTTMPLPVHAVAAALSNLEAGMAPADSPAAEAPVSPHGRGAGNDGASQAATLQVQADDAGLQLGEQEEAPRGGAGKGSSLPRARASNLQQRRSSAWALVFVANVPNGSPLLLSLIHI